MATSAQHVLAEAMRLSEEERGELVRDLLDSFGAPPTPVEPAKKEWLAEIERRACGVLAREPGIPWEEVRSTIRADPWRVRLVASLAGERLETGRQKGRRAGPALAKVLMAISRRCSSLPDLDTRSADEILGYDESGAFR